MRLRGKKKYAFLHCRNRKYISKKQCFFCKSSVLKRKSIVQWSSVCRMSGQYCDIKCLWTTFQSYIAFGNVAIINQFFQQFRYIPEIIRVASASSCVKLLDMHIRRWGTLVFQVSVTFITRCAVCGFFVAVTVAVAVQMRKKRKPQQATQMHQNRKPQTAKPSCGFVAVLFAVAVVGRFWVSVLLEVRDHLQKMKK